MIFPLLDCDFLDETQRHSQVKIQWFMKFDKRFSTVIDTAISLYELIDLQGEIACPLSGKSHIFPTDILPIF